MSKTDATTTPFHNGERQAQARAGVGDVAKWAGGFIRDHLPEQHRAFHTAQPFLIVSGSDAKGQTWVTLVEGPDGFASSPDPRRITLDTTLEATDPLAAVFEGGTEVGVLGIELATRRRNRFSGRLSQTAAGYQIDIRQTFGNCPQYIHERRWTRAPRPDAVAAQRSAALSTDQIARIARADTLFIGSGHEGAAGAASNGYDASHRGGAPGFVHVVDESHLQIPDYAGNNFFNTIGNILADPRVGLLFVDFETGGLLHITGRAAIDWAPRAARDAEARRVITVEIDAVLDRPSAVGLRWSVPGKTTRPLRLAHKVEEAADITSFYLEPTDDRPLAPFEPGQHLPIEVQIPGRTDSIKRTYSLSGAADDRSQYRLSVKRDDRGLVSRFLHDSLREGDVIEAGKPSGDFVTPCSHCPLVLVSAGVGLTPMLSILHAKAGQGERPVWFVHGARNGREHAMDAEVQQLVSGNERLHRRVFYSRPEAGDVLKRDYDVQGRITARDLIALGAGAEAHYLLCGPSPFLADLRSGLEAEGVSAAHIHFETFGPAG